MVADKDFASPAGDLQPLDREEEIDFGHGPLAHMRTNGSANLPGRELMDLMSTPLPTDTSRQRLEARCNPVFIDPSSNGNSPIQLHSDCQRLHRRLSC